MFGLKKVEKLSSLLLKAENEKDLQLLLKDLLTPGEIDEVAQRIKIFTQLNKGDTQRDIAGDLDISITTVTRWSKALQQKKSIIRKYL